jgi:hypothetical protein
MRRWCASPPSSSKAAILPLTSWFPYLGLGSPQFLHYQSLPAMLTGLIGLATGPDVAFRWSLYLLLARWPVSVYFSARLFGAHRWAAGAAAAMATVNPVPDGGTVRFTDPGTTITGCGAVPVNTTGQATCTTTFTVMGSHQVQAIYSGDASFTGSQSPVITQMVSRKTTSLHLSSSVNPVVVRRPVTYLAVVSPVPGGGGVTFLQDGRPIRGCVDVPVQRTRKVTCRWSYAFPPRRTIQARYTGTARFAKSTSNQLTETVKATHKHRH